MNYPEILINSPYKKSKIVKNYIQSNPIESKIK